VENIVFWVYFVDGKSNKLHNGLEKKPIEPSMCSHCQNLKMWKIKNVFAF
jgi:hypothetical protein